MIADPIARHAIRCAAEIRTMVPELAYAENLCPQCHEPMRENVKFDLKCGGCGHEIVARELEKKE